MAAGDSVGATPPISAFFGDTPDDRAHEPDGDRHRRARQPQLRPRGRLPAEHVDPARELPVRLGEHRRLGRQYAARVVAVARVHIGHGVTVGFVGFTNDDVPTLTKPGALRPVPRRSNSTDAVNAEAAADRSDDRRDRRHRPFGATAGTLDAPDGPAGRPRRQRLERRRRRSATTPIQVLSTRPNGVLVDGEPQQGPPLHARAARDRPGEGGRRLQDGRLPQAVGTSASRPTPRSRRRSTSSTRSCAPIFSTRGRQVDGGHPAGRRVRGTTGRSDGRACESLVGDLVTDAMRRSYGTDFAITNSGGLRADLTCPGARRTRPATSARRPSTRSDAGKYPITRGQVLGVLPFGNVVRDADDQRRGAEGLPRDGGLAAAGAGNGRFGAGLGPLLHVRHRGARRHVRRRRRRASRHGQSRHGGRAPGG